VNVGSRVIFVADEPGLGRRLWVTDGTSTGTHRVSDAPEGAGSLRSAGAFALLLAGNPEVGRELWRTDATPSGTFVLGSGADLLSTPVAAGDGWVYSTCDYGVHGWLDCRFERTDGTASGTGPVGFPSASSSDPMSLTARDTGVVFRARPGVDVAARFWGSDGTEAGTVELDYTGVGWLTIDGSGAPLADGEAVVPGMAEDVEGGQVFRTDGGSVSLLGPFEFGPRDPSSFVRVGGQVFFAADSLWKTDGTAAGTAIVRHDLSGRELTDVFGKLWLVELEDIGATLWESAGTAATTIPHPIELPAESDEPEGLLPVGPSTGSFAFRAGDGVYLFDPITDEAVRLHDLSPTAPPHYEPWPRAAAAGALFFFDGDPDGSCALWKSDGTPAGTLKLKNVDIWGCWPVEIVAMGDRVYFRGCDAARGCELWRSDGSTAGTVRFTDLDPGPFSSMPGEFAVVGDRLYFSACDPAHGCEPWVTAGTPASTHRLGDVAPGKGSSRLEGLTGSARLVFFAADDGTGSELWAVPQELFYDGFETGDRSRW
jgi:ELWxxDGT repeat protein